MKTRECDVGGAVRLPKQFYERPLTLEESRFASEHICAEDDMKPSVAGLALAFGRDRRTLWKWANGIESDFIPPESRDFIKKAYQFLNAQMEDYAQNGKINPVAAIFLMKNHFGYQDKQEVVLTPNNQLGEVTPPEELQQKYLEATASDYDSDE